MIQTSCSELLVDTAIHSSEKAAKRFAKLFIKFNWECNPSLSVELLEKLKKSNWENEPEIVIYDKNGNRAWLQYGNNGYITTGFRLDSQCNHCDSQCFPIFKVVIEELKRRLIACDGGSEDAYEEWRRKNG